MATGEVVCCERERMEQTKWKIWKVFTLVADR